ncbi:hypothetical protein MSAN_02292400 [Mycena sanguinolenta]|uniref:Uncharacterized protein n=1 Tax=Mycena sanguinolenta TaxID=230812 RepID=A0A8H6X8V0_9AGAR|nr:hypothetical protein MSAN_02292400 [Mycena sanguinolenta]
MLHHDLLCEVLDAVQTTDARSFLPLSLVDRGTRALVQRRWFRVVCVSFDAPLDFGIAGSVDPSLPSGFPLFTYDRFTELARTRTSEMAGIRHLNFYSSDTVRGRDAFDVVYESCPLLETLWLEHVDWFVLAPNLRGLGSLRHLRELTIPFTYATQASALAGVDLPGVTHLHFSPVMRRQKLAVESLRSFPDMTHLGFAREPSVTCTRLAAARSPPVGVLVRGPVCTRYLHPRVVYLPLPVAVPRPRLADASLSWVAAALRARTCVGPMDDIRRRDGGARGRR